MADDNNEQANAVQNLDKVQKRDLECHQRRQEKLRRFPDAPQDPYYIHLRPVNRPNRRAGGVPVHTQHQHLFELESTLLRPLDPVLEVHPSKFMEGANSRKAKNVMVLTGLGVAGMSGSVPVWDMVKRFLNQWAGGKVAFPERFAWGIKRIDRSMAKGEIRIWFFDVDIPG